MKIIAIAGGSASGKSLFAAYLGERLPNSRILSLDHFYFDRPQKISLEQYNCEIPNAFDFKTFHQLLEEVQSLKSVILPSYDFVKGKRQKSTLKLSPGDYLILEGAYVLMHASIRSLLAYSFFLESPSDVILSRRLLRDLQFRKMIAAESIDHYFHFARQAYFTYVLPTKQYANMVVENEYQSRLDLFLDDFLSKYHL